MSNVDFRDLAYQMCIDIWHHKRNLETTPGQRYALTVNQEWSWGKTVITTVLECCQVLQA
eukprot:8034984-Ditylum_brightwellii.AAC.1